MATVFDQTELDRRRLEQRCEQLGDEDLVGLLLMLLAGNPPINAASTTASSLTRVAFFDIARRWIPPDIVGEAFRQHIESDDEKEDGSPQVHVELVSLKTIVDEAGEASD